MLHTAWKGKISFGLIDIPIKLHGAIEEKDVKLRTLHSVCHTPIHQEKHCQTCGREVESDELVKGYETATGQFVVLSQQEIDRVKEPFAANKAVELLHFVSLDDIDPLFFDKPYYISPGETSLKAYYTLLNALEITNKVGIANVFLYSKQQIAIIRSVGGSLVLHTMHFEEELRSVTDVPNLSSTSSINESDTQVTVELIDKLSTSFNPSIYKNNYRDALQNVIQQKINQGEVTKGSGSEERDIRHLMEMLKVSIDPSTLHPTKSTAEKKTSSLKKKA